MVSWSMGWLKGSAARKVSDCRAAPENAWLPTAVPPASAVTVPAPATWTST
jgi:hypothetical protein